MNSKQPSAPNVLHIVDSLGLGGVQTMLREIFQTESPITISSYLYSLRKKEITINIDHPNIIEYQSSNKYSLGSLQEIKKIIKERNIKILHCHQFKSQIFGYILKKLYFPHLKLILHEHGQVLGSSVKKFDPIQIIYYTFLKIANSQINHYIAISQLAQECLITRGNVPIDKISVLYNFVNLNKFQPPQRKVISESTVFRVGFIGRLIERKGWKDLVKAVELIHTIYPIKLVIAGDGAQKNELLKYIEDRNLGRNVEYLGYIEDIVTHYHNLDVVIIPSHWEAMGLIEIEAQATGVPVIVSDVKALNEVVTHDKDALLFSAHDSQALSDCIQRLIESESLREQLSVNGLENAKKYSLDHYLIQLNDIYQNV